MKPMPNQELERFRLQALEFENYGNSYPGTGIGLFGVRRRGTALRILSSTAESAVEVGLPPWDHVSVSTETRTPTWEEMCWVKDLFFSPEEVVVQFHPKQSDYVNYHPYTLHLWRLHGTEFPMPPSIMVGVKGAKHNRR